VIKPRTAPVLLQFAKNDDYFSGEQDIVNESKIVAEPKTVKIYEDGAHELNAEARRDRVEWLTDKIGLKTANQKQENPPQKTLADYVMPPVVYTVPRMSEVKIKRDLIYKKADKLELKLDVYQSPDLKTNERRPAVFFVHGGTPLENKPKDWGVFQSWGKLVAASGMTAVIFNHQNDFALGESDLIAAIDYVRKNAADLSVDENRIAVVAYSAGGPLLSGVMQQNLPYVKALGSFYALLDTRDWKSTVDAETLKKHSPILYLKKDSPPIFIAHAGNDFPEFKSANERFVAEALKQNIAVEVMNHPTGDHGFDNQNDDARSKEIIGNFIQFLNRNLTKTN
jgi:acetyl esterase/lipase